MLAILKLLPTRQSAYRRFHSTETAVAIVHNNIVHATNSDQVSALVLLDLSAAFDTVDHGTLLDVLSLRFGITGSVLEWFKSYLTGRTQILTTSADISAVVPLICSVPQGSAVGSLLFIAFTGDIEKTIEVYYVKHDLYADDTQLLSHMCIAEIQYRRAAIENCVLAIQDWCASRCLQLNPAKTEIIWFGSRSNLAKLQKDDLCLKLASIIVNPSETVWDVGVLLDSELTMRPHFAITASTCFSHLRWLRQLRRCADQSTMQRLVSAFVIARLDYCNLAMAGLPTSSLAHLNRVLSAAVRLVAGLGPRDHVTEHSLHWLPIQFRIKFKLCVLMHSAMYGQSPSNIKDVFVPLSDLQGHSLLRSAAGQYDVPFTRTQ